jgi:hypothetical protein
VDDIRKERGTVGLVAETVHLWAAKVCRSCKRRAGKRRLNARGTGSECQHMIGASMSGCEGGSLINVHSYVFY